MRLLFLPQATAARRRVRICLIATMCLIVAGCSAAYGYDRRQAEVLLPGTSIAGVGVGGMEVAQATELVIQRLRDPLHRELRVRGAGFDRVTTPWELGMRVDVESAIAEAVAQAREGHVGRRVWRRIVGGGERELSLEPTLDESVLTDFVEEAAAHVKIEPTNARVSVVGGWLRFSSSSPGLELDLDATVASLSEAVRGEGSEVTLPTRVVAPSVPSSRFATAILVRAGENKLYLYRNGSISRSYTVATGSPKHATPVGSFEIVRKRKNPTWVNPGSDWSKKMPVSIRPGPDNPLGSRALDINSPGIRIHGTPDSKSIGYSVSHGCVRMHMAEAEDLFERVSEGTKVFIVQAGPPKLRTQPKPPASPAPSEAPAPTPAPA